MGRTVSARILLGCAALALSCQAAWGEWAEQTLTLEPGWNAVFLEVTPDDNSCEAVFAGLPIESVWFWNKRTLKKQFLVDPNQLRPEAPDWITYFPEDNPKSFLTSLHAVQAGGAYLIQLAGTEPVELKLVGRVLMKHHDWLPDSLNMVGFPVSKRNPPTFAEFFAGEKALEGQAVYRITADGLAEPVADPATAAIERGEAYWVYCEGDTGFRAPLDIEGPLYFGLNFSHFADEQTLSFENRTDTPTAITLRVLPGVQPESKRKNANLPVLDGEVKLAFMDALRWVDLEEETSFAIGPNSTQELQLAVRRADMAGGQPGRTTHGGILEIEDLNGTLYRIPLAAEVIGSAGGLWAGTVTVSKVAERNNTATPETPTPASGDFNFRLIVHIDDAGTARLLQHVTLLQLAATEDEPSRYVLLTDDELLAQYVPNSVDAGFVSGRRLTSPVFAFADPVEESSSETTGEGETSTEGEDPTPLGGTAVTFDITTDFDDPLNPFVHTFHPDHDNLNERFEEDAPLDTGAESYTFTRSVTLEFANGDNSDQNLPNWGYSLQGGTYKEKISFFSETVTGSTYQNDFYVEGTFQLTRVSDVLELNDGN